jgi:hypothetical protein
MNAACGPPKPIGTPKRCADPTATSAPMSPGDATSTQANRSVVTIASAPHGLHGGDRLTRRSSSAPLEVGDEKRAPKARGQVDRVDVADVQRRCPRARPWWRARRSSVDGCRGPRGRWCRRCARPRRAMVIASAAAVASSSRDAFASGQTGQLGHHRLEVQQRLQTTLTDLGLVGRVGRVPGRVLEHVACDHRRCHRADVAHPDQAGDPSVPSRDPPQPLDGLDLGNGVRQVEWRVAADRGRHRLGEELVDRCGADDSEHRRHLLGRRPDVPATELVGLDERAQISWGSGVGHGEASCSGSDFPGCHRYLRVSPGRALAFPVGDHLVSSRVGRLDTSWRFPACLTRAVRGPERFRGGCSFGAVNG